ncbi:MAG: ChaN family lipoprotein [Deltaproteobacteria bacterium]|nr:ChaN family lipoprotein [Deltaproteobacteria bacterium]
MRSLAIGVLLIGCTGCGGRATERGRAHPLTGRIYRVNGKIGVVGLDALLRAAAQADVVLIGERHDHPAHHLHQARLLKGLIDAGRRPAVVWEMITDRQASVLVDRPKADLLGRALGWDATGWPSWKLYQPIAVAADLAALPFFAGGIDRAEVINAVMKGARPQYPLPGDAEAALRKQLIAGHCGHSPGKLIDAMSAAQQLRDQRMARRIAKAFQRSGSVVLIAGNGHARADRGAPYHLRRIAPQLSTLSIGQLEVTAGQNAAEAYLEAGSFDYVWFTERIDDQDPCERFRRSLERMKRRHHKKAPASSPVSATR